MDYNEVWYSIIFMRKPRKSTGCPILLMNVNKKTPISAKIIIF